MSKDHEKNEFEELEKTLRSAFKKERMPGLLPDQLNKLHSVIDGSSAGQRNQSKKRSLWAWIFLTAPGLAVLVLTVNFYKGNEHANQNRIATNDSPPALGSSEADKSAKKEFAENDLRQIQEAKSDSGVAAQRPAAEPQKKAKVPDAFFGGPKETSPVARGRSGPNLGMKGSSGNSGGSADDMKSYAAGKVTSRTLSESSGGAPAASAGALAPRPQAKPPASMKDETLARAMTPSMKNPEGQLISVDMNSIKTEGRVSASTVQKLVKSRLGSLRACYHANKKKRPELNGELAVSWRVGNDGKATDVKLKTWTMNDQKTIDCTLAEIKSWGLPAQGPGSVSIKIVYY